MNQDLDRLAKVIEESDHAVTLGQIFEVNSSIVPRTWPQRIAWKEVSTVGGRGLYSEVLIRELPSSEDAVSVEWLLYLCGDHVCVLVDLVSVPPLRTAAKDENVIMLLGSTGSGKTCFIHTLAGWRQLTRR